MANRSQDPKSPSSDSPPDLSACGRWSIWTGPTFLNTVGGAILWTLASYGLGRLAFAILPDVEAIAACTAVVLSLALLKFVSSHFAWIRVSPFREVRVLTIDPVRFGAPIKIDDYSLQAAQRLVHLNTRPPMYELTFMGTKQGSSQLAEFKIKFAASDKFVKHLNKYLRSTSPNMHSDC